MIWRLRFVTQIGGGLRCETKKRGGLRYARLPIIGPQNRTGDQKDAACCAGRTEKPVRAWTYPKGQTYPQGCSRLSRYWVLY